MKLYKFNILNVNKKLAYIGSNGLFIDNHIINDTLINYYVVDNFLVEIIYNTECQSITEIKSVKSGFVQKKIVLH
ncbi:hypothetical protein V8G56_00060 [Gaetbulibacter aquiaggeris]|uniref:Uncharacterized protein n=1 Tax=Gaetbulibacter aquiaggeris TaxID=1735373 RepID=A0ABW7MJV9_9FLAO